MFPIRRCPVERSPVTGRGAAIAHEPTCYPRPTPTDYQQAMSAAAPSREQRPASRRRRTRFRRAARSTVGFWIPRDDSEEQARQGRPPQSDWRHLLPRREGYLDGVDKRPASRGTRAPARPDACKVPANAGAEAEAGDGLGLLSQRNASLRRFGRRQPRRGCFRSNSTARKAPAPTPPTVAERQSGRLLGMGSGRTAQAPWRSVADASVAAHGARFSRQGRVTASRLRQSRQRRDRFAPASATWSTTSARSGSWRSDHPTDAGARALAVESDRATAPRGAAEITRKGQSQRWRLSLAREPYQGEPASVRDAC
jgi:hypothetical protein